MTNGVSVEIRADGTRRQINNAGEAGLGLVLSSFAVLFLVLTPICLLFSSSMTPFINAHM